MDSPAARARASDHLLRKELLPMVGRVPGSMPNVTHCAWIPCARSQSSLGWTGLAACAGGFGRCGWRRWWQRFRPPWAPLPGRMPPGPPPWAGPPEAELGVAVPLRAVLARQPGLVIALTDCVAYSNGFSFGIAIRSEHELDHRSFGFGPPSEADRAGSFEVRVRFADERESAVSGYGPEPAVIAYYLAWQEGREPEVPAGPVIGQLGGGGGGKRMDFQYWVWPLPPDGPLSISCAWLKGGMAS